MSEQLETSIDVDAVLNELEALVETLHACCEEAQAEHSVGQHRAFMHALQVALNHQAAIMRLVLNDLTVTTPKE